jgi:hypothetical protein
MQGSQSAGNGSVLEKRRKPVTLCIDLCGLQYYTRMPWNRLQQHVLFSHSVPTQPLSPTGLDWLFVFLAER